MSKTKVVGYLLIVLAVLKAVIDALDGNGFEIQSHFEEVMAALGGAGLIFLRSGVDKAANK